MRILTAILILLILVPVASAASLKEWKIDIALEDDKTSEWRIVLQYDDNITKSDYYILARLTGVEIKADDKFIDCLTSTTGLGTSILCNDLFANRIEYRFRAHGLVSSLQNLEIFQYRFPISQNTDNYSLTIKLPLGTGLVERSKLEGTGLERFEPVWGKEGSDGRRIFLEWDLEEPKLWESLDVSIVYERIVEDQIFMFLIISLITVMAIAFLFFTRRKPIRDVLHVLTDNERRVMEIIINEKKDVDQRRIVRETDFSKTKVSRIIQTLVEKDLIEKIPKGRNNLIRLKIGGRFKK